MSVVDSWITIACAVGVVLLVWLFCNRVANAWRGLHVQPASEGAGPLREERGD